MNINKSYVLSENYLSEDINAIKGLGIYLVVLGHSVIPSGFMAKFIFSFHMPLL